MNNHLIWEIIGYAGSVLVLVSLLMTSIVKLRIINAVGCIVFSTYAFVINSIPTALMNAALFIIDVVFLIRILSAKADLSCVMTDAKNPIVRHFCEEFAEDIGLYFDSVDISSADVVMLIFDNETVAGLLAGVSKGDSLKLLLDYTTGKYRDYKVGPFVHEKLFESYSRLIYSGSNEKHCAYCEKMGYVKLNGEYVKTKE